MEHLILLCAATQVEASACRNAIQQEGLESKIEIVRTNMGPQRAEEALTKRLNDSLQKKPSLIISSGFAGGRNSDHSLGNWVLGTRVRSNPENGLEVSAHLSELISKSGIKVKSGEFVSVDFVLGEEGIKNSAEVVDMESFAIALTAKKFEVPFSILRMISDTPDFPIPEAIRYASVVVSRLESVETRAKSLLLGITNSLFNPTELMRFGSRCTKLVKQFERDWRKIGKALVNHEISAEHQGKLGHFKLQELI
jgi:hypothetical protein